MQRNAILLVVDGLRAAALGAYGNSGQPTPAFDQLASESLVLSHFLCDSPERSSFYESVFGGRHAIERAERPEQEFALLKMLACRGVSTELVTDAPWLEAFAERLPLDAYLPVEPTQERATSIEDTAAARLLAVAAERLLEPRATPAGDQSQLTWIHAGGMQGPWDAPLELRESQLSEGDPPALDLLVPPELIAIADPDDQLLYRTAYEAEVEGFDFALGGLLAAIDECSERLPTLLVVVGSRGFSLGEHGQAGTEVQSLYGEVLHTPCLIRLPPSDKAQVQVAIPRFQGLAQPWDLGATLADWFASETSPSQPAAGSSLLPLATAEPDDWRLWAMACDDQGRAMLRTQAWMYQEPVGCAEDQTTADERGLGKLYVKPDDRWECNEVADRCETEVEAAQAVLAEMRRLVGLGEPLELERLDERLATRAE